MKILNLILSVPRVVWVCSFLYLIQAVPFWNWFSVLGGIPNLLLLFLTIVGFREGIKEGVRWGFILGLITDIVSGIALVNTVVYPLVGFVVGLVKKDIFRNDFLVLVGLSMMMTLVWAGGYHFIITVFTNEIHIFNLYQVTITMILHGILTPVVARLLDIRYYS